ncbi:MAG TPA: DUF2726 domain-containing protein [Rubrivivax sp.]|nr:DUF2726 domain-containing protein [Rubrivivax sp.]
MELFSPIATLALPAAALLLLSWLGLRLRQRHNTRRGAVREALDTVAAWPPEASRILTINERQAYDLLRRAMPGFLVLAQVPLSRFIRVPARHSYADWLGRVGSLSADLMLCDSGSRVLAVIDVRAQQESDRGRRRHDRMARVLRAAQIHVFTWREGELPTPVEVRNALIKLVSPEQAQAHAKPTSSRPMPLIPVAEISEVLADGDRAALEAELDPRMEPVPSAFFDDLDPLPRQR